MPTLPPNDPLPTQLAAWQVRPRLNSQFRAAVWARLEAARRPSTWARFARAHAPAVSALLVGAAVAGAWSGRTRAQQRTEADRSAIAATYVHSLDARWMRH